MSCWRVLDIAEEPRVDVVPQLLFKPQFGAGSYTLFLTDLSNIWSEQLDLAGVVSRAAEVSSPIEVNTKDVAQLAVLIEHIQLSLSGGNHSSRRITRDGSHGVTLHTTTALPEPLDALTWEFHLQKRSAVALKNELILPLLVSSHIQHERVSGLISIISDKDRAITRLVDQYESCNLDLAAAFPSISGVRGGRRLLKREQAAKHIPGLQKFRSDGWRKETADLVDTELSTLGLFQEALSECTPKVPAWLKSEGQDISWWLKLDTVLNTPERISQPKDTVRIQRSAAPVHPARMDSETEDETEDEFETHNHFKSRGIGKQPMPTVTDNTISDPIPKTLGIDAGTEIDDDEDDDLDALPKSQSQIRKPPTQKLSTKAKSPTPELPSSTSMPDPKAKGFKIGGKSGKVEPPPAVTGVAETSISEESDHMPTRSKTHPESVSFKPTKKGFTIGGKLKAAGGASTGIPMGIQSRGDLPIADKMESFYSIEIEKQPAVEGSIEREQERREETAEEKAERKRQELKRKNEELAKKQVLNKNKKKRF